MQAVRSTIPMAVVLADREVSELWVASRLVRKSAYNQNKAFLRMCQDLLGADTISKSQIPDFVILRRVEANEFRDDRGGGGCFHRTRGHW